MKLLHYFNRGPKWFFHEIFLYLFLASKNEMKKIISFFFRMKNFHLFLLVLMAFAFLAEVVHSVPEPGPEPEPEPDPRSESKPDADPFLFPISWRVGPFWGFLGRWEMSKQWGRNVFRIFLILNSRNLFNFMFLLTLFWNKSNTDLLSMTPCFHFTFMVFYVTKTNGCVETLFLIFL
jgi:hypothetical protein